MMPRPRSADRAAAGPGPNLLEEAPWALRFSESPQHPARRHQPSPKPVWCPTSPRKRQCQPALGYRECSPRAARCSPPTGQVSSDDAYNVIRAQLRRQHRGQAPAPARVRRAGRQLFTNASPPIVKRSGRPARRHRWLHKGPSSSHRAAALDRGHGYEAGGWIHNDPTVRPTSPTVVYTATSNGKGPALQAPETGIPRWRPAAAGGWFLVWQG